MTAMATQIASGLAAAAIATIVSTASVQAMMLPNPQVRCPGAGCPYAHTSPPAPEATPWLKIGLGAASGVALAGAGVSMVSSRKRHQPAATRPVAG
jgi:hypothetical protein